MKKTKVLWVGDGGVATGFARVNHSIIDNLPDRFEVHHLAVNYNGDPYDTPKHHRLYPARIGGDLLGINRIQPLVKGLNPDLIFILNDPWVIPQYLARITTDQRVIAYTPVDAQYLDKSWAEEIAKINQLIVYTEFGKNEYLRAKPDFNNIKVVPHGTDIGTFYPKDKAQCRKDLGISQDKFIVLSCQRNQPRKRVDLTIKAFAKFAQDKPDAYLYLHMGTVDAGWDINKLCERYGVLDRLIKTSENISPAAYVSNEDLNSIYNACDVSINTSMGEGWSLTNTEQACCKIPQIVPNYSATKEIFTNDMALHIDIERIEPHLAILTEGCIISVDDAAECMNRLYYNRELGKELAENAYNKFTSAEYSWKNVTNQFVEIFDEVIKQQPKAQTIVDQGK
jgi:glycosyltransferase involved in cell wall biosynthesis